MAYLSILNHTPLPECIANHVSERGENNFPIGKVHLKNKDTIAGETPIDTTVYYFKGYQNKNFPIDTILRNTILTRMKIPKFFRFVNISVTPSNLRIVNNKTVNGINIKEGRLVGSYQGDHVNGLFAFSYNYITSNLEKTVSNKRLEKFRKLSRNLKSRIFSGDIAYVHSNKINDPFSLRGSKGSGFCPFWVLSNFPQIDTFENRNNNINPIAVESNSREIIRLEAEYLLNQSSITSLFFKYQEHYFTPLLLDNGTIVYYAFENEEILKYWIYRALRLSSTPIDIAGNGNIYYENILGIFIAKEIELLKLGYPNVPFWD